MAGAVLRRASLPLTGGFVVILARSGFSCGSSCGGAKSCSGAELSGGAWSTDVLIWSAGVSWVSVKLCWVAVDSPLDSEDDLSGL